MFLTIKTHKRPFTLLEVLIAFLLIAIAAVPLVAPYSVMFKSQKRFTGALEQDRLASLYFVDLLAKILRNEIDPSQGGTYPIPVDASLPYSASYVFKEDRVDIAFTPKDASAPEIFSYTLAGAEEKL